MKNTKGLNEQPIPVNKELDKFEGTVLFPQKMAKANEAFQKFGAPKAQLESHLEDQNSQAEKLKLRGH